MSQQRSKLDEARAAYRPALPAILDEGIARCAIAKGTRTVEPADAIRELFPRTCGQPLLELGDGPAPGAWQPVRVGVVLSGGQAPGGHNVIAGLLDGLRLLQPASQLFGFLGGPRGVLDNRHRELTPEALAPYRNTGGFDLLGSGRDKIETPEQLAACEASCKKLELKGLVIVGGDDSNTNAAVLAEYFVARGYAMAVLGVPKTIDGDLKGDQLEASFGFDTATKVYAELIGNLCRDARSAGKYWHFVRLMGRSASHVTLECALQTRANLALIAEEVREKQQTLEQIAEQIANVVQRRAEAGRSYGVILVPEGLIEFIPEVKNLIAELNRLLAAQAQQLELLATREDKRRFVVSELGTYARSAFEALPERIQEQLLLDRDAHGNVQVSKIETELLLIEKVRQRITSWQAAGRFPWAFQTLAHFFGYEGRCAQPSNFDAAYTYALGRLAAVLASCGKTGYLCSLRDLASDPRRWRPVGVPLTSMMRMETRKGLATPVVARALVRTDAEPFRTFADCRDRWGLEDHYLYPGPIQYFGPPAISDAVTHTLRLERP